MASAGNEYEIKPIRTKSVTLLDGDGGNNGPRTYNNGRNDRNQGQNGKNDEDYSDEEVKQTTPMLTRKSVDTDPHQVAAAAALKSQQSYEQDRSYYQPSEIDIGGPPKQPNPTGKLAWAGFGLSVFALTCMCLAFASPYWIQQWPLSFSTFENMGLWEVCFHNYMHHRDDLQEIYNGCWWVFDSSDRYDKLRDWLLPPWFLACQVMCTASLLVQVTVVIVTALVFLHMCPMMNHEYHQIFAMFISGAMMLLSTMTSVIVAVLFGIQIQDRNWMPRPDWNFLSWGFGFLVLSGMLAFASGLLLFASAWRSYNKLLRLQDDYFKQAMEMSAYPATNYSQVGYGPGPEYPEEAHYEKQSLGKLSYGHSQASIGKLSEKGSHRQQSYDEGAYYDRQRSMDSQKVPHPQNPHYDDSRSYHDEDQSYYDQQGYRR